MSLTNRFPSYQELISLEPGELGAVLLMHVRHAQESEEHQDRQLGPGAPRRLCPTGVALSDILYPLDSGKDSPEWPVNARFQVQLAMHEAWEWLISTGLILKHPRNPNGTRYILTRRGATLSSEQEVADYRDNGILPAGLLHPRIMADVRSHFMRGHYDTAVFHAFREVEIAMREASGAPAHIVGDKVARFAFDQNTGPLRDPEKVDSERLAEANLIAGAIGCLKNPGSHRRLPLTRGETARLVIFASHLLYLIDERKAALAGTEAPNNAG